MKNTLVLLLILFTSANRVFCQVKHQGIIQLTARQSIQNINGIWNTADHTGNAKLDKAFDKYAATNKINVKAIRALETTAAAIRTNPQKYINPDGGVNTQALQELINQKFASIGEVTIPSLTTVGDSTGLR